MKIITKTADLKKLCDKFAKHPYFTIDTEFIREKTYYPNLCLIQVANDQDEAIIDPLAEDIDLAPLFKLLQNKKVLKVFHGGRQDVEIFYYLSGKIPTPIFDTQIAGMVVGFGDQIGYESLIKKTLDIQIDKGSRFTDWSHRPLTDKQLAYAMADVTHLRLAYKEIIEKLEENGRAKWVDEEMEILTSPETYDNHPEDAWQRVKINTKKRNVLGILKEVAAWREVTAQTENKPRGRILKDNALKEIALHPPKNEDALRKIRSIHPSFFEKKRAAELLKAVERGKKLSDKELPKRKKQKHLPPNIGPIVEMLKVLLRMKSEKYHVAPKLLANTSDLEQIAAYGDKADVSAMKGWRREIFGDKALQLKDGKLGFVIEKNKIAVKDIAWHISHRFL